MARKLQVNDEIYIPSSVLPESELYPYAIYRTRVIEVNDGRMIKVNLRGGEVSEWIASSKAHENVGIAIICIGDFSTEDTLLNPLSKSILQYCRLLIDDSSISLIRIRAMAELAEWWRINNAAFSHIIFIGHGSANGIKFGIGGIREAEIFKRRLPSRGTKKKVVISLCCDTGHEPFVKDFSKIGFCSYLIAPAAPLHGAIASQFCQSFLLWNLLHGKTTGVAFKGAIQSTPGDHEFKLWQQGKIKAE